jgi:GxxExxY protein
VKPEPGYRLDLRIEGQVIVELKSGEALCPLRVAVLLTQTRLSGHRLGLLINFNVTVLKEGVRRYIL